MKNIVFFDLETRLSASQVGGWHETAKMGMSVGVTYSTADKAYHIYTQIHQLFHPSGSCAKSPILTWHRSSTFTISKFIIQHENICRLHQLHKIF